MRLIGERPREPGYPVFMIYQIRAMGAKRSSHQEQSRRLGCNASEPLEAPVRRMADKSDALSASVARALGAVPARSTTKAGSLRFR